MRFVYSNAKPVPDERPSIEPSSSLYGREVVADPGRHGPKSDLVDVFLVRYIEWREACDDLRATDALWSAADRRSTAFAFFAHSAALEREEAAAMAYSTAAGEISRYDDRSAST